VVERPDARITGWSYCASPRPWPQSSRGLILLGVAQASFAEGHFDADLPRVVPTFTALIESYRPLERGRVDVFCSLVGSLPAQ